MALRERQRLRRARLINYAGLCHSGQTRRAFRFSPLPQKAGAYLGAVLLLATPVVVAWLLTDQNSDQARCRLRCFCELRRSHHDAGAHGCGAKQILSLVPFGPWRNS